MSLSERPPKANSPQPMQKSASAKRHSKPGAKSYQNLFVACLPRHLTNADLSAIFEPYGATSASVMMDPATGKSKGFGFVSFPSDDEGRAAIERLNSVPVTYRDQTFSMHLSASRHESIEESPFVYFRNVPSVLGADTIRAVFAHYGHLVSIQTRVDSEKEKEFALVMVEYANVDDARNAIKLCNGDVLFPQITQTPILAKFADAGAIRSYQNANASRRAPLPKTLPIAIRRQPSDPNESYGLSASEYHNAGSEPSSFTNHMSFEGSVHSAGGWGTSGPSSLAYDADDTGGSLLSTGCSLNDIPNGKLYRHEPYSRNGYVVTPVLN